MKDCILFLILGPHCSSVVLLGCFLASSQSSWGSQRRLISLPLLSPARCTRSPGVWWWRAWSAWWWRLPAAGWSRSRWQSRLIPSLSKAPLSTHTIKVTLSILPSGTLNSTRPWTRPEPTCSRAWVTPPFPWVASSLAWQGATVNISFSVRSSPRESLLRSL
ncbi:hypothetical protein O3P69_000110 [Scylla paramamosain]|uniref:Secreted protein n=1 Tax=Scylla paramamosain TaxID=85552 RepID=A0AAW0UUR4_SCYPA